MQPQGRQETPLRQLKKVRSPRKNNDCSSRAPCFMNENVPFTPAPIDFIIVDIVPQPRMSAQTTTSTL